MLNHLQILIHPVIFLVEGEVHQLEAVGEFEHRVVGDGATILRDILRDISQKSATEYAGLRDIL